MTTSISSIIATNRATKYATDNGTQMHDDLRRVVIDRDVTRGAPELVEKIKSTPNLAEYFCAASRTEVPVAGTIGNRFISRRIDRMVIDETAKHIRILDYKTDTDPNARRAHYITQLTEYAQLMRAIYPRHTITAHILWTHDWHLEEIKTLENPIAQGL